MSGNTNENIPKWNINEVITPEWYKTVRAIMADAAPKVGEDVEVDEIQVVIPYTAARELLTGFDRLNIVVQRCIEASTAFGEAMNSIGKDLE